jgi:hypothetical protein
VNLGAALEHDEAAIPRRDEDVFVLEAPPSIAHVIRPAFSMERLAFPQTTSILSPTFTFFVIPTCSLCDIPTVVFMTAPTLT